MTELYLESDVVKNLPKDSFRIKGYGELGLNNNVLVVYKDGKPVNATIAEKPGTKSYTFVYNEGQKKGKWFDPDFKKIVSWP